MRTPLFLLALSLATPALAEDPHGAPAAEAHGVAAEGHGAAAEGHGAAAHHVTFTDDDDKDGTANWLDHDSPAYVVNKMVVHAGNLLLFLGVVLALALRPVRDVLGNRAIEIRNAIHHAASLRETAKGKHDAISARLDALDAEIAKLKADAVVEAAADEKRLNQRAEEEADRIAEAAERNIADELQRAKVALRMEAVDLAVQLAEQTLRGQVQSSDQQRLASQFLDALHHDGARHG